MPYTPSHHHRRSIRLKEYDYSQEGLYFVTICVNVGANNYSPDYSPNYSPDNAGNNTGDNVRAKDFSSLQMTQQTSHRPHIFGDVVNGEMILNEYGQIATQCWTDIPQHFPHAVLHEYVVMPNHVHGIIQLSDIVGANNYSPNDMVANMDANNHSPINTGDNDGAKDFSPLHSRPLPRGTSRTIGSIVRGFKIGVSKQLGHSVWQRDYWEHVIRNDKSHQLIADYILNNPANWENDKFYS